MKCKFCGKICKNANSHRNHERLCKKNPDRKIPKKTKAWYDAMAKNKANQYIKAERLGLTKPKISEETRKKQSKSAKKVAETIWTKERRKKHSDVMKVAVKKHSNSYTKNNVCGRVKSVEYKGIKLKGKWELKFAQWLDKNDIIWEYETEGFPYKWNEDIKTYFPDFFIPQYDFYIEVKGYKTKRDEAKWNAFPNKLAIANVSNIDKLDSFDSVSDFLTDNEHNVPVA